MNALQSVKQMEQTFRNAGFEVTVNETEKEYRVEAITKGKWFETTKMFYATAWKSPSNRWVKFFSVSTIRPFGETSRKGKLTTAAMWFEINFTIKYSVKVGA